MNDNENEEETQGFPLIPLSHLRELFQHARLVMLGGDFGERDLWRLYVAIEANGLMAGYWYGKFQEIRDEQENHEQASQNS